MVEGKDNRIAILDLDSILFSAAWGNKILDEDTGEYLRDDKGRLLYKDKTEEEIAESIDYFFNTILTETNSTHYIAYVKGKSTGKHRYVAKSDYKSNRPKESPSWWEFAKNYSVENWKAMPVNYLEVDDAVNITRLNIPDSFIVAIDKDLLNLEGTHYNWKNKEWVSVNKGEANNYFWADMIIGQPGDGISGLPGKGKAYFKKLSSEVPYWSLRHIIFDEYCAHYGESKGITEFYKNYTCLKILEEFEGFEIPAAVQYIEEVNKIEDILDSL